MLGRSSGLPSCVVEAARCCDPRSPCVSIRERVAPSRVSTILLAYLALTKPRVIELLLVTAIPAMLLAPRGRVGLVVGVRAFVWLWWAANLLSGLLAVSTIAFYVFVYTLLLKRRTSQNVVWGGAAGCMPVMIAWSAVTGTIGWQALAMFAIIFFWTPPHTWALAMRYKEDYKAAGVPMLPAVATERQVTRQILFYTWLTVAATLVLALAATVSQV